jgi:formylmethanofuran dehydrogenase subunit A
VRDIYVQDGRVVSGLPGNAGGRTMTPGMVVMPVEWTCTATQSKVNLARKIRPDDHRTDAAPHGDHPLGVGGSVPSTFTTGYRYAAMGYTTAFDAAVPPLSARHAHEEFRDTPVVDKGFFALMGNNEFILQCIASGQPEKARHFAAWLLQATKAYAIKLVNPGGVELWKFGGNVHTLDDEVTGFGVTAR